MTRSTPSPSGSGPKVTKQGKSGPIIGKMSKVGKGGTTKPWKLNKKG